MRVGLGSCSKNNAPPVGSAPDNAALQASRENRMIRSSVCLAIIVPLKPESIAVITVLTLLGNFSLSKRLRITAQIPTLAPKSMSGYEVATARDISSASESETATVFTAAAFIVTARRTVIRKNRFSISDTSFRLSCRFLMLNMHENAKVYIENPHRLCYGLLEGLLISEKFSVGYFTIDFAGRLLQHTYLLPLDTQDKPCYNRLMKYFSERCSNMKIIVCGCGKIGSTILASLVAEGHDVTALDQDPDVVSEITNIYDVMGVCGNGADCETLDGAGIAKTELFIAVTSSDEVNMLSCFLAKRMGASYTIARIRNPEYNDSSLDFMKRELGLSMAINPELLAARELFDVLGMPSAAKVETFSGRSFEMVELKLKEDSPLDGLVLKEMREKYKTRVLICIVQRGDEVYIPGGDFVLKVGDKIGLTASPGEIQKFLRQIGLLQKKAKSVMIMGGGRTAYYLAKMLEAGGSAVKIVEIDEKAAEELTEDLPDSVIIRGDGAEQELLLEEGLRSTDAFVTLTGMDEQNILISIYAMSQNVPKVIAKVSRDELSSMAEKLGLDCIVSPRKIIADVLVQYARALENSRGSSVETLYKLMDGQVEALEFHVHQAVEGLTDVPLKLLQRKPNILIAGIIRGRRTIVPGGDDCILPGDKVVVLAANQRLPDLADILK